MKSLSVASLLLSAAIVGAQATDGPTTQQKLKNAITASERINILDKNSDFVFDFKTANATKGAGGRTVSANIANFPALFGGGLAMTLGFMNPCSLNSPHTHPRATEVLLSLNGTLQSGFFAENGARFVMNTIEPKTAAVFPKGSIHFQANLACQPAFFVATLSNEDPGTLQIAQNFFGLPSEVIAASLGSLGVQEVQALAKHIPDNLIQAVDSCFAQCGLTKTEPQPTAQQRPPTSLPTGSSAGSKNSGAPPPKANSFAADIEESTKGWFKDMNGTKIALLVLAGLNLAAIVGALVLLCVRSAKNRKRAKQDGLDAMATETGRGVSHHSRGSVGGVRPLLTGTASSRGKYEAAQYELPHEDHGSSVDLVPRKYDDPYDRPPSRAREPLMPASNEPYRD